jgi:transposase
MGASNYTYVEASMHRDLPSWIGAHIRAFEFFQGCPLAVVPDNWKTAVNRACRYMPDVNVTYQEMAAHYGVAVVPARPRKPRDKVHVSYCTLFRLGNGEHWLSRATTAMPFDNCGILERLI